jgi:hypothetical protein
VVAAAVTTGLGLAALLVVTGRALAARRVDRLGALHATYWCASAVCAVLAYVMTSAAYEPSDRYIFVVVPAIAAPVPILARRGRRAARWVAGGATIYVCAGLVAFAAGAMHTPSVIITGTSAAQTARIASVVRRDHLTVGYAGYWNASSLEWSSRERLHVYPLLATTRTAAPMFSMRVASWYRPRARVRTYLVRAPGDPTLPDRPPTWLPAPSQVVRVGRITLEIWPYDIAAYLGPSEIPIPGLRPPRPPGLQRSEASARNVLQRRQ